MWVKDAQLSKALHNEACQSRQLSTKGMLMYVQKYTLSLDLRMEIKPKAVNEQQLSAENNLHHNTVIFRTVQTS